MFNVDRPTLVFSGPCHLPVTGSFYGWSFDLYEYDKDKPRGLFFSHISEAVMFVRRMGGVMIMDESCKPGRLSALDYILTRHDHESDLPPCPPDGRTMNRKTPEQIAQAVSQMAVIHGYDTAWVKEILADIPTDADNAEAEAEGGGSYEVDWAGSTTGYAGGRTPPRLDADADATGGGFAATEIDWFGDD